MKRILVIIIAVVGLSIPTMAQRLLPHQKGIEVSILFSAMTILSAVFQPIK